MKKITVVSLLALLVAIIAPLWAVLAQMAGLQVAAVALISAGLYVANGAIVGNALKITLGFVAGNFWAYFVVLTIGHFTGSLNPYLLLFLVLFVYIIPAVFISCFLDKVFDLASWLCAWATTLTLLLLWPNPDGHLNSVIQIGIAMVAGVWVVGVLITSLHKLIVSKKG